MLANLVLMIINSNIVFIIEMVKSHLVELLKNHY